jgi:hypothetical protein
MHVAAQPIELCDGDSAFLAAGLFQRGGELRPAVEGIGSFLRPLAAPSAQDQTWPAFAC